MSSKLRIVFFAIGLSVFIYLISQFGLDRILFNIRRTGWWFLPVIGVWGLVYLINSFVWYFIVDSRELKFSSIFQITVSGFAINYITPFVNLGGEPYRIAALKNSLGLTRSISSVLLYTILHFLSHFIFWILAILLAILILPLSVPILILLASILCFLTILSALALRGPRKGIAHLFFKYFAPLPGIRKLRSKFEEKETYISDIDNAVTEFYVKRKNSFFQSLGLDLLSRFVAMFEFFFILRAIGINAGITDAFFIAAGSSLIMNLFFFIPLTLGVREGGLLIIMHILNFTSGVGIYVSIINRIREFFWILIGLLMIQIFKSPSYKNYQAE